MKLNPLIIIFANLLIPLAVMLGATPFKETFYLSFAVVVLLLAGRFRRLLKFAAVYALLLSLRYAALRGYAGIDALLSVILVTIVFFPCTMMASTLICDYAPTEILTSLDRLRLPKILVIALTIMLRYFPTFRREFRLIKESMRCRGIPYTWKKPIRSFEYFIVPQLFRCMILAEEITSAGTVKGIDAPIRRTSYFETRFRLHDAIAALALTAGTIGGLYVG